MGERRKREIVGAFGSSGIVCRFFRTCRLPESRGKGGKRMVGQLFCATLEGMRVGNPLVGIGRSEKRWERWEEKRGKTMNISYCTIIIK